jgi:molybdenum cofactor cytidylyltransferase
MIAAIVLAAGASSRFGDHKLLAPVGGKPLVRRSVEAMLRSQIDTVLVVLGRDAEAVRECLVDLPVGFVVNTDYRDGMSTSLIAGVGALGPDAQAVLIALGDQPLPSPAIVDRLLETYHATGAPIVTPVYRDGRGNPVLFAASVFPEILAVRGDEGARAVIARDPSRLASVHFPFAAPPDVDTPEDYQALLGARGDGSGTFG